MKSKFILILSFSFCLVFYPKAHSSPSAVISSLYFGSAFSEMVVNCSTATLYTCDQVYSTIAVLISLSLAKQVQDIKPLALAHEAGDEIHPLLKAVANDLIQELDEQGYESLSLETAIKVIKEL